MATKVLKYILFLCLAGFVVVSAISIINDPDTLQYLAHGKYILEHGFGAECVFNYTSQTCQIAFSEWFFHILTYLAYLTGQWNGLVVFQVAIICLIFLIIFANSRTYKYHFLSTAVFVFFAVAVGMERFMLRADLFSILTGVLFYYLLKIYLNKDFQEENNLSILSIILLLLTQLLWANTHGSFPLGPGFILAFFAAELALNLKEKYLKKKKWLKIISKKVKVLGFLFLICLAISMVNPFGLKAFYWPFNFFFGDPSFHSQMEFESPFRAVDFKQFSVQNYELLVFLVAMLFLANIKKVKLADLFIMLPLFYLSAKYVRNIALFAALAALIMPPYLDNIFFKLKNYLIKRKGFLGDRKLRFAGQAVLALLLLFFAVKTSYGMLTNDFYVRDQRSRRFGLGVSEINFPTNAANFIKENNLQGNFFNDYALGTFVNWELFPERQSFIDGHSYTLDLLHYYQKIMSGFVPYQEVAAKYNINYFFLNYFEKDTPVLVNALYHDRENWVPVYFDELSIIFIANKPENQEIIDKYAIDFENNKNFDPENLKSIKDKVDFSVGRANRGVFFYNVGLWEKAEYEFQKAVEAQPNDYISYQNLGSVLQQLSKYDLAIGAYESALKINSKFAPAHYNLGLLFQKKNMMDEAIKEYKKALSINRKYPLANYSLGVIYETRGDKVSARISYQNELKINPGSTDAQNALNRVSSGAGYSSESIDDLKTKIEKDPNNADLHFRLAIAYGLLDNQDGALEEFEKAVEIKPDFALAHLNLGNVYSLKNRPEDAKKEYEKAIELDPKLPDAYLNLGVIYRYSERDNQKAVEYWQKFLDLAPNDPQAKTIQQEILRIVKEESGKQ